MVSERGGGGAWRPLYAPRKARRTPEDLERLIAENRKHGIDPDGSGLARSLLREGAAPGRGDGPGAGFSGGTGKGLGDDEDPFTRAWEALDR